MKCFASSDGDHLTLINVFRRSVDFLKNRKMEISKEKSEKLLRKWCKENFINSRSLRHARDIHRSAFFYSSPVKFEPKDICFLRFAVLRCSQIQGHVEQMGLHISSCGDDILQFRRCLAASFFLNAALKQPEGTYR